MPPTDPIPILLHRARRRRGRRGRRTRLAGCPGVDETRDNGPLAAAGIPAGELQLRATVDEVKVEGGSLTVGCVGAVRSAAADGFAFSPHRAASIPVRATRCISVLSHPVAPSGACSPLVVQHERRQGRWSAREEWCPLLLVLPPGVVVERADQRDNHEAGGGGGGAISVAMEIPPLPLTPSRTSSRCRCPFYTQKYAHKKKKRKTRSVQGRTRTRQSWHRVAQNIIE